MSKPEKPVQDRDLARFEVDGKVYVIHIDFATSYSLKDKFDFNLIKMFSDDVAMQQIMMKLMLDTEFLIDLCWFFIESKVDYTKKELLVKLPTEESFEQFREAFWAACINFSSPLKKGLMMDAWKGLKKEMRKAVLRELDSTTSTE